MTIENNLTMLTDFYALCAPEILTSMHIIFEKWRECNSIDFIYKYIKISNWTFR